MIEIWHYVTASGRDVFDEWVDSLKDENAKAKIAIRISRLASGNLGDSKPVQGSVRELRIDYGPGYRIYYAMEGNVSVLLLCGGDKRRQAADIERAIGYWFDYKKRNKKP